MDANEIIRTGVAADPRRLEPWYCAFVSAMTGEGLHSKADIAQVLAWQAQKNARLREELEQEREEMVSLADGIQRAVKEAIGVEHYNESPVELVWELRNALDDVVSRIAAAEAKLARVGGALKGILWLIDAEQLVEKEPSHCGPIIVDEARAALAAIEGGE